MPQEDPLAGQVGDSDPYVKAVRVGRFKPGVMRLVFDLKTDVRTEVFTLKPIAEYGHRQRGSGPYAEQIGARFRLANTCGKRALS